MSKINLRNSNLFCIVGPSGSGKSSLCSRLLELDPRLSLSISATSRAAREGEVQDQHYHFLTKDDFQQRISQDQLFEWELVHGNYYGTLNSTLNSAAEKGRDLLLDIEIRGALNFRRNFPANTVLIFVSPPSLEVLVARVSQRAKSPSDNLQDRLKTAVQEFSSFEKHYADFDYLLINDDFNSLLSQAQALIVAERLRIDRHFAKVSELVRGFLTSLNGELSRG